MGKEKEGEGGNVDGAAGHVHALGHTHTHTHNHHGHPFMDQLDAMHRARHVILGHSDSGRFMYDIHTHTHTFTHTVGILLKSEQGRASV